MKIVCFGDSNTFGCVPGGGARYDRRTRWTGRLQNLLGKEHQVVEEGLNGRTTVFDDQFVPGRRGLDDIGMVAELHSPFDLLIIMLGTNDCKDQFRVPEKVIAEGMESLLKKARESAEGSFQILLIAPAPLSEAVRSGNFSDGFDETSIQVSRALAGEYKALAEKHGCGFLDASKVIKVSVVDGVHLDAWAHEALAEAIFAYLGKGDWDAESRMENNL